MTFSLGDESISIDDTGCVLITDINPNGDYNEDALICTSERSISSLGDWYLHPTEMSTDDDNRIDPTRVS